MDIYSLFASNETLEVEGTWFNLNKTARVKVARSGNPKFVKMLRSRMKAAHIDFSGNDPESEAEAEEILSDVMAETILVGWEGLEYQGAPAVYSKKMARTLLSHKDFRKKISTLADDAEAFRVKAEEDQGNA